MKPLAAPSLVVMELVDQQEHQVMSSEKLGEDDVSSGSGRLEGKSEE